MWKSQVEGQVLHFELAAINNQNFIMRDRETGSWWQQVTGEAIQGPLKGQRLELVSWDEVSFEIWRKEYPRSLVLKPDERFADRYYDLDWAEGIKKLETVVEVDPQAGLEPRSLVVGIKIDGHAKAYPLDVLAEQSPVVDEVGSTPVVLVVAKDGKSVRGFERTIEGEVLDLYRKPEAEPLILVDAQTGSEWNFQGQAIAGPRTGQQLRRLQTLKDFWFDWQSHHPETGVYSAGF